MAATKMRWSSRAAGWAGALLTGVLALAGLGLLAPVLVVPLELRGQVVLGGVMLLAGVLASRLESRTAALWLVMASALASTRYIVWRLTSTVSWEWSFDAVTGIVLLSAEMYAWVVLLLGHMVSSGQVDRKPLPLPSDTRRWPVVDVFIPTYDEDLAVVRATVLAARAMDWPADKLRVFLLDDGRRDAFRAFAMQAGVGYLRRSDNRHAKAGNLNHALSQTSGDLIAIFDCDHVPTRSFLQMTVGWLVADPRIAVVQARQHFYSPDPFERNLSRWRREPGEQELFYGLLQRGNDLWNAAFFCGSCAVIRRKALCDVGGFAVTTVTEDAHTALRMHRRGWRSAYLDAHLAAGLATENVSSHIGQRMRWARGMAQIFRTDNPLLGRGLRLGQRLCYLSAMLHFFHGLPRLVFLLAPLAYLVFGAHVFNAPPALVLAYAVPHLLLAIVATSRLQGRHRASFWAEVHEALLSVYVAVATTAAVVRPKSGAFNVTAKGGRIERSYFDRSAVWPCIALLSANLVGIAFGAWLVATDRAVLDVLAVNLVWAGYNATVCTAALAVAVEARQVRDAPRVPARLEAMVRLPQGRTLRAMTRDLCVGGGSLELSAEEEIESAGPLWVSLLLDGREIAAPARVVSRVGKLVRVQFDHLAIEDEALLVRAIFSRADAWVGWLPDRGRDRPLRELLAVFRAALALPRRVFATRAARGGAS